MQKCTETAICYWKVGCYCSSDGCCWILTLACATSFFHLTFLNNFAWSGLLLYTTNWWATVVLHCPKWESKTGWDNVFCGSCKWQGPRKLRLMQYLVVIELSHFINMLRVPEGKFPEASLKRSLIPHSLPVSVYPSPFILFPSLPAKAIIVACIINLHWSAADKCLWLFTT